MCVCVCVCVFVALYAHYSMCLRVRLFVCAYLCFTGARSARTTILMVYAYSCVYVFVCVCCGVFVRARVCASTGGRLRKSECVCVYVSILRCVCVYVRT